MILRIAGILPCSFVNGDGARYVVFTQGCSHHCPGCQNPETWDFTGGLEMTPAEIAEDFRRRKHLDGITLSGGDPFFQQEACLKLLELLPEVNAWVYTGFEYEDICNTPLAKRADVLVVGPFSEQLRCEGKPYGSSNQRVIRKPLKIVEVDPSIQKSVKANDGYCPCAIWQTPDTKCMCKEFRDQKEPGKCHCGRFEKVADEGTL